jgi:DnaD/phage-associated family protein
LKGTKQPPKKYKSEKYYDFNIQVQDMFPNRPLVQNEYVLLYEFIDSYKVQTDAMLMIIQYCVSLKGLTVRFPYIIAVAKNWANEGIKTVSDVELRLSEYESQDENMKAVLKALSRKGVADLEEKQLLLKWTKNWGFDINSVVFAAKCLKNNRTFKKLDSTLDDYYKLNIFTEKEMLAYVEYREKLHDITIKINSTISVYYETLDHIIETYTAPWLSKGFDEDALLTIAHYCFLSGIRTLSGMNGYVSRFYKLGLISKESINEYIEGKIQNDEVIKKILHATGSSRGVTANDREFYKVWCMDWGFTDDVLLYGAELASATHFPLQYLNKLLSNWKESKLYTLDEIKASKPAKLYQQKRAEQSFTAREYTKEELAATFDSINNFDSAEI